MTTTPTNGAASRPIPAGTPICQPCGTAMIHGPEGHRCLNCGARVAAIAEAGTVAMANALNAQAARLAEHDQIMRDLARAVGMSPVDSPAAIVARVAEEHRELVTLRPAIAAFRACYEGLPSHVHTRPVCATTGCDNHPKRGNLCNRCYEQKEGR